MGETKLLTFTADGASFDLPPDFHRILSVHVFKFGVSPLLMAGDDYGLVRDSEIRIHHKHIGQSIMVRYETTPEDRCCVCGNLLSEHGESGCPKPTCVCGKDLAQCDADEAATKPSFQERALRCLEADWRPDFTRPAEELSRIICLVDALVPKLAAAFAEVAEEAKAGCAGRFSAACVKSVEIPRAFKAQPCSVHPNCETRKRGDILEHFFVAKISQATLDASTVDNDCTCGARHVKDSTHSSWCDLA
jgi:hypothetical protein